MGPRERRRRGAAGRSPPDLVKDTSHPGTTSMSRGTRAVIIAWLITAVYYFYQYALRSAPSVMMPQLSEAYGLSAMGTASMIGLFYYGFSPFSLVAGAAIDRLGPRRVVP